MVGGSLLFLVCVTLMPFAPAFCAGLRPAGHRRLRLGRVRQHADLADRAACAAAYPFAADGTADGLHRHGAVGILLIGVLADRFGPLLAVDIMALTGLVAVSTIGLVWRRMICGRQA